VKTQTFEASSIREAMFRVRESLGPDAVILGTREIRRAQANAPSRFAVTAATSPAAAPEAVSRTVADARAEPDLSEPPPLPAIPPLPSRAHSLASPPSAIRATASGAAARGTWAGPAVFPPADAAAPERARVAVATAPRPTAAGDSEATVPTRWAIPEPDPALAPSSGAAVASGSPSLAPSQPPAPPVAADGPTRTATIPDLPLVPPGESPLAAMERRLTRTISDMRDEIARLQRATRRAGPATDDPDPDVRGLVAAGVEAAVAAALVTRARERVAPDRGLAVARQPDLEAEIRAILDPAPPLWARHERVIAAIVGPTGAGKTRTVAKLAALATFGHNARVGIITTDTRRIGGLETLEAFCRILGLPLRKARDAQGLAASVERYADKDLILIDTPGAGPWDDGGLAQLDATLSIDGCERHLAIPAVSPAHDVRSVARRFAPRDLASIIVTKLDEARGPGAVLSAAWGGSAHLSHVCDGQDVPDACRAIDPIALARGIVARVY
jgi:flagellar biosynthesis protein FlhF